MEVEVKSKKVAVDTFRALGFTIWDPEALMWHIDKKKSRDERDIERMSMKARLAVMGGLIREGKGNDATNFWHDTLVRESEELPGYCLSEDIESVLKFMETKGEVPLALREKILKLNPDMVALTCQAVDRRYRSLIMYAEAGPGRYVAILVLEAEFLISNWEKRFRKWVEVAPS